MKDDGFDIAVVDDELSLEDGFLEISEDKFPSALTEGLDMLEKANDARVRAKKREEEARSKVKNALLKADELISLAKGAGKNTATHHSFLGIDLGAFDSDEIYAIKKNLKELVDCGINSAEAQKDLAEVQQALLESQSSLLYLSQTQQQYLEQTFKFSKVLCGFTALNQARLEFLFQNLKEKLDGASKEKLGEMAFEQILVVMDQWKNQQNILMRLNNNERLIDNKADLDEVNSEFERIKNKNVEQDERIDQLTQKGNEVDAVLKKRIQHDDEQDKKLIAHEEKDKEHDSRLNTIDEKDAEQDKILNYQKTKDEEHDRRLDEGDEKDINQDNQIIKLQNDIDHLREEFNTIQDKYSQIERDIRERASIKQVFIAGAIGVVAMVIGILKFIL